MISPEAKLEAPAASWHAMARPRTMGPGVSRSVAHRRREGDAFPDAETVALGILKDRTTRSRTAADRDIDMRGTTALPSWCWDRAVHTADPAEVPRCNGMATGYRRPDPSRRPGHDAVWERCAISDCMYPRDGAGRGRLRGAITRLRVIHVWTCLRDTAAWLRSPGTI